MSRLRLSAAAVALLASGCGSAGVELAEPLDQPVVGGEVAVTAPATTEAVVPVDIDATVGVVESPVEVALRVVEWKEQVVELEPGEFGAGLYEVVHPDASDVLAGLVEDAIRVREIVRPGTSLSVAPVKIRPTELEPGTVRVEVWAVQVFSDPAADPRATWTTVVVDLERVDGEWLVTGLSSRDGPVPASPAVWTPGLEFDEALLGFVDAQDGW